MKNICSSRHTLLYTMKKTYFIGHLNLNLNKMGDKFFKRFWFLFLNIVLVSRLANLNGQCSFSRLTVPVLLFGHACILDREPRGSA